MNRILYWYAGQRGYAHFGCCEGESYGSSVMLTHRELPMLMHTVSVQSGRYETAWLCVFAQLELDKPYFLSIGKKGKLMGAVHTALRGADRAVDAVAGEKNLIVDYGYPEVYRGRHIRTDHVAFTGDVLKDLELRTQLEQSKKASVLISPAARGTRAHSVCVRILVGDLELLDLTDGGLYTEQDRFERENAHRLAAASETLDRLITLTYAARDAALRWRIT